MTAVSDLNDRRARMRRESDAIRTARPDAVLSLADSRANHPSVVAKQRQVERQQVLGSLVAILAGRWDELTTDTYLPLLIDVLVRNAPQVRDEPAVVAIALHDATVMYGSDPEEAAFVITQLAAGTASTVAYGLWSDGVRSLVDHLKAATA